MSSHLDLEHLSAALDGEGTDGEHRGDGGHLATCATCQRRMAGLASAAAVVAPPVPPLPAEAREAVLAAALEAWSEEWRSPEVAVLPTAVPAGRVRAPWPAVAAVLFLIALAVPLAVLLGGRGTEESGMALRAADDAAEEAAAGASEVPARPESADGGAADADADADTGAGDEAGPAAATPPGEPAPVDGGDVGQLGDPPALAILVGTLRDDLADLTAPRRAGPLPCGDEARLVVHDAGPVAWAADGRAGDTPVAVHAVPAADGDLVLVATAVADCEVLASAPT